MSSNHTTVSLLQKSFQHFSTLFKYINGAAFSGNHVVRLSGYPCIICIGRIVTLKGRSCFLSHVDSLSPLGYHLLPNRNIHGLKGSEPAQHGFLVETFFWRIKSANWAHVFGVKTTPGNASEANNPWRVRGQKKISIATASNRFDRCQKKTIFPANNERQRRLGKG